MKMRKILSLLLALIMVLALFTACGEKAPVEETEEEEVEEIGAVSFPLEEPYVIDMMVKGSYDWETNLPKMTYYQKMVEMTNVTINPINLGDEHMTTLNAMFAAGNEGEVIIGNGVLNDSQLMELAYAGLVMPIEDYITNPELMPNYHNRGLKYTPQAVGAMTAPDGHIYSVARLQQAEYSYLESPLSVNMAWVEASGADISTIEGFEQYLAWVRDNDANGNGNPSDETPFLLANDKANAYSTLQAVMAWWGMPTKNSTLDAYVTLEDGEVLFVPTMDAYKDAIQTLNRWYEEGLIWSEYYTANTETFNAKLNNNETCMFGASLYPYIMSAAYAYYDELEFVAPPVIEGYEAELYYNCGINGYKNTFTLTNKCERPDIVLAWLDYCFYSLEGSLEVGYGLESDPYPRYHWNEDRTVFTLVENMMEEYGLTQEEYERYDEEHPGLLTGWGSTTYLRSAEDYEKGMWMTTGGAHTRLKEAYDNLYKPEGYINEEVWPRPYYTEEVSEEIGILRTDIFNTVTEKEANWVTGVNDIEADWADFNAQMEACGVARYVELLQETYNVYLDTMAEFVQ